MISYHPDIRNGAARNGRDGQESGTAAYSYEAGIAAVEDGIFRFQIYHAGNETTPTVPCEFFMGSARCLWGAVAYRRKTRNIGP